MRKGLLAAATALLLTTSWVQAQDNPSQNPASAAKPGAVKPTQVVDEKPITALPYTPSLEDAFLPNEGRIVHEVSSRLGLAAEIATGA